MNENDVVNVKVGDEASVKVDAYGDRKFHGTVYQIANTGTTTGAGTQEEVTNFQVKIRIDDHDVLLRPGLFAPPYRDRHGEGCGGGADAGGNDPHQQQQFEPGGDRKEERKNRAAR